MKTNTSILGCLLLIAFAISMNIATAQPPPLDSTKAVYIADCNDPDAQSIYTLACTDVRKDIVKDAQAHGYPYYIGHDEPALQFFSNTAGSGNNMKWKIQLPNEPTPTQNGAKVANFELFVADWLGLALCDPSSNPFGACTPNSDTNNPNTAGSAFLELQFFPPGLEVSNTQWSALLHINSYERSNSCIEPTTAAFITTDGTPGGPKLLMNNGDDLVVTMRDTGNGLEIVINDLTTATTGTMVASGANGFFHTDPDTCAQSPFDYHPEYSTAKPGNVLPWGAIAPNVDNSFETGHWELCGDAACTTKPDGGDADDSNFITVRGIGGTLNTDSDLDGTPYNTNWPDGSANHPSSLIIGSPDDNGFGPLSFDGTNYLEGYNRISFVTATNFGTAPFYPFYSQAGTGTACRINFGNDITGTTTNDFGKTAQYGTTINNPCLSGKFDYSLSVSPSDKTILTGDTAPYGVTATLNSGTAASVSLSASGLPSLATASFSPASITPTISGTTSILAAVTSNSGGLGDYILTVQGTGGGVTPTANTNLHVYDFTVGVSPSDQTVLRGGGTSYTATLILSPGSTTNGVPAINLGTLTLPGDATVGFSSSSLVPTFGGVPTTLTIGTASPPSGSLGDFPFSVTGTAPFGGTRSGASNLHIYDFNLAALPPSLQILTTGSNSYSITDTLTPGSSAVNLPSIGLSLSGLPSGATDIFTPISGSAGGFSSILGITTSNTPSGTDILTVTGKDARSPEGGTRTVSPTLVVLTPQQALQLIINKINAFQSSGVLNKGQANSLIVKLENVIDKLDSGKPNTACNDLGAFVNEVNAYVKSGTLTQAQADTLLGGPLGINAISKAIPC